MPAGCTRVPDEDPVPGQKKIMAEKARKTFGTQISGVYHGDRDKGPLIVKGIQGQAFRNEVLDPFLWNGKCQDQGAFKKSFYREGMVFQITHRHDLSG